MKNEKKKPLILPLQFFAEEGTAGAGEGAAEDKGAEDKGAAGTKSYSQSELDAEISRATEANRKKLEKAQQDAINKAIKDYAEKAKLSDEERVSAELKELQDKLQAKERELTTKERITSITADLQKEGMPIELAPHLVREEDEEKVKASLTALKKAWDNAINAKVKEALRQADPKSGNTGSGKTKTPAELIAEARNKQNQNQGYDPWAKK